MIDVLWIDDQCFDELGYPTNMAYEFVDEAYGNGIEIKMMSSYKEGLEEIKANPSKWCAVILDIREQAATDGNAADGFAMAREEIKRFQIERHQQEPYIFVLSGEKQYHEENSPMIKEAHCSKKVYDKNGDDYNLLFRDILKIENVSELWSIQKEYKDVLEIASKIGDNDNRAFERLMGLIKRVMKDNATKEAALFTEIRKYLEDFIFPKLEDLEYFKDMEDEHTLNNYSRFIGGKSDTNEYIRRSFHSIVSITNDGSHGSEEEKRKRKKIRLQVDGDVRSGKAPYLLRSCLFDLFNIIIWMDSLLN